MFKKLILLAIVLTAQLATATPAFAQDLCDPPPTPTNPNRTLGISCYVDTSYSGTTEMGTRDQPFKDPNKAIAAAQAHPYGGYVYTKTGNTWTSQHYAHVNTPGTGTPISRAALFVLLGLASLLLVTTGWFLMQRSRTLPKQA